jgi:hypothetical protein
VIELGVVALLAADSGVSALAGNRTYPLVLPLGTSLVSGAPAITYQSLGDKPDFELDGGISWMTERIRLKCHGVASLDALNLSIAVHNLLDKFSGQLPEAASLPGMFIQFVEPQPGPDFYLSDQKLYGKTLDFVFHF